jgi:cytochrome c5
MTYQGRNGKQYVVIAAGGTNRFRMLAKTADESSDALIAFALPGGPATGGRETTQVRPAPASPRLPAAAQPQADARTQTARATRPPAPSRLSEAELKANGGPLPDGTGKDLVMRMCTKCHGTAVFTRMRMGRMGWEDEVTAMVERGAAGTDQEIQTVIDYMVKNFGR